MSLIVDDFKKYRDQFGMSCIQLDENGKPRSTQNGALFTMEYLLVLMAYADHPTVKPEFDEEVARIKEVMASLEVRPGVTCRIPGSLEFDSMDNGSAHHTFSGMFDGGKLSERKVQYGESTRAEFLDTTQDPPRAFQFYPLAWIVSGFKPPRFFWNIEQPKNFCFPGWHGRSPGHMAMMRLTAGRKVGFLGMASIWVGQFLGCFANVGNTDARKLPYVDWQFLKNRSWFWKMSYRLWCRILMKQYKRGMQDVYATYYGPNHPMTLYSPIYLR